ncbi:MAG: amino acid adenylation domain-containing protein [Coleofasciculaceae cyanobacterium]
MSEPLLEEEVYVFPASFAQARLWFIDQLVPGNAFYNVPTALRLRGVLNLSALEQTFKEIVRRHETLRTRFAVVDGELVQAIATASTLNISLPVIDLQQLDQKERDRYSQQLVSQEYQLPFNLATGPLIRVLLLQLDKTEYILLLTLHHIVSDDWSIGILIRELKTIYTAFALKKPSPLPELALQYADFAEWQHQWLQGESGRVALQKQLTYWRQQLAGISLLKLPTDRPKPAIQSYQGATQFLDIPKSLVEALKTLSQQEGATLFMTLLAAFQILLNRYTQQEDITIGTPIANRNRSEIEPLIGFFVNSLVLRTNLSGNPTFRELLNRVKEVTLEAYAYQDLPFEKLVEELHPERNLSTHPLFQTVFALQNSPMEALDLPGLTLSSMAIDFKTTRFDLEFHLWESTDSFRSLWGEKWKYVEGLRGIVVYNTDLFDEATINRLIGHFKTLLEAIITHPDMSIYELPLLSPTEQHQLVVEWNNTVADYPKNLCVHQLFEKQVERCSQAIAVTYENQEITYGKLNERSNQLAHYLQKLGVKSGVLVGICLEPSLEMIIAMLGILKAGGAYVPLDTSYPEGRLKFMIEDAQLTVLLTNYALLKGDVLSTPNLVYLDRDWQIIQQESQDNLSCELDSDQLAYIIYTSGSTGKPKGVTIPHKAINRLLFNTNYIKINASDKIAQVSNTSFDAATFEIWGALLHGAQLVGINREVTLSPQDFAEQLQQKGISIMFLTTALFQQMARSVPQAFASLRYLLFGGEVVNHRWVQKILKNRPPQNLIQVYGPTENTTFATYYKVKYVPEEATHIPIGRPITNTQIYLLDKHLKPVPIGVIGELFIGGEGLAKGYLNRPDLTAQNFVTSPPIISHQYLYKTGDLAIFKSDGNLEFMGRVDHQVKIRGYRIELEEIEALLTQHPLVVENAVLIWEEIPDDKQLVAYVVPDLCQISNKQEPNIAFLLRQFLKEKLPNYMIPSTFIVLDALPLTPNGKVNRRALKAPNHVNFVNKDDYVSPRTNVEELLGQIWSKVLGKQSIGVYDNFFELGGHSLLATQLTSRIRDAFQIEMPVSQLFEAPTIASLAKYIETINWVKQGHSHTNINNKREEAGF